MYRNELQYLLKLTIYLAQLFTRSAFRFIYYRDRIENDNYKTLPVKHCV